MNWEVGFDPAFYLEFDAISIKRADARFSMHLDRLKDERRTR